MSSAVVTTKSSFRVAHALVSKEIGGAENYLLDLCRLQRDGGLESDVILSTGAPIADSMRRLGVRVTELPIYGDINPITTFRVAAQLRKDSVDILNVHDNAGAFPCCLAGRAMGIPALATVHAFHCKWSFVAADHIITVSDALRKHLIAQNVNPRKITLVHSGIDLAKFRPRSQAQARKELGLDPESFTFVTVGRLAKGKGTYLLLGVFSELVKSRPCTRLVIVGTGPIERELKLRAKALAITDSVTFTGFMPDVRPAIAASDCLVLPSEREGLGLVLLEAMAMERAVIATDSGGPKEVVRDGETGILAPNGKADELVSAMYRMMSNPSFAHEAGLAGRNVVESEFRVETEAEGIESVYRGLLRT